MHGRWDGPRTLELRPAVRASPNLTMTPGPGTRCQFSMVRNMESVSDGWYSAILARHLLERGRRRW
jgi:hypothetical protein